MTGQANPFEEFRDRYGVPAGEEGPLLFVREVLGVEVVDGWQESVLRAFGRGERRISIASCPGVGKSAVASWLVIYMLLFRFPQNTVATAPSTPQLEDALVVRIHEWIARLPPVLQGLLEVKKNRIELKARPSESWFSARTAKAESPEAFQGVHSKHTLLIADEASGVPEEIYKAGSGSMTDLSATTLLISNPTRSSGFFYDTHHKLKDMWFRVKVGYKDSPRVSEDFRTDIARRYGEDSNEYRIRVLGEFPKSDLDTIIGRDLVDSARVRDVIVPKRVGYVWGLDVARFGDDENCLVRRSRLHVDPRIMVWSKADLMDTVGKVKGEWDECDEWTRPSEILVDEIGLGAGVVDALRRLKMPGTEVRGINVGEASSVKEKFLNLRSELWFAAKDWLASKNHALPKCSTTGGCAHDCVHERLASELTIPRYKYTMTGKLQIEPKDEIKKRGFKSPNCFVAGTMIRVPGGGKPIESLREGDRVLTPYGTARVIRTWASPVERLTIARFGASALIGTPDHKVFTWDGWTSMDALTLDNTIESYSALRRLAWRVPAWLSTEARRIGFKHQVATSCRTGRISPSDFFIGRSGRTRMARFRTAITSTIETAIRSITNSPILSASPVPTMLAATCWSGWPISHSEPMRSAHSETTLISQPHGIAQKPVRLGTRTTASGHGSGENSTSTFALTAAKNLPVARNAERVVPAHAGRPGPWPLVAMTQMLGTARSAAKALWRTVTGQRAAVVVSVQTESVLPTLVYNLTLDRDNAYYANDVLVANCADAFVLSFAGEPALMMDSASSWNQPLKRDLHYV